MNRSKNTADADNEYYKKVEMFDFRLTKACLRTTVFWRSAPHCTPAPCPACATMRQCVRRSVVSSRAMRAKLINIYRGYKMTKNEKMDLVDHFVSLSCAFDKVLELEGEILLFRPMQDAWSITEQVMHCVDFDVANFHRYRWGITKPGTQVLSFDGSWVSILNCQQADIGLAITLIKSVRKLMSEHLRTIIDNDWTKYIYTVGQEKSFNLEEALRHFNNHVGFHCELIDRNIKMFTRN